MSSSRAFHEKVVAKIPRNLISILRKRHVSKMKFCNLKLIYASSLQNPAENYMGYATLFPHNVVILVL